MHTFNIHASAHARAIRNRLAVRATVAPSKPQRAGAKKPSSVIAKVNYIKLAPNGEELFTYPYEKPHNIGQVTNMEHIETEVPCVDLRTLDDQEGQFTLPRNGFQFQKLHVATDIDWRDDDEVGLRHIKHCLIRVCLQLLGSHCAAAVHRTSSACAITARDAAEVLA